MCFKSLSGVKSTQDEKVRFIKGNELYLTQSELFSILFFQRVRISKYRYLCPIAPI